MHKNTDIDTLCIELLSYAEFIEKKHPDYSCLVERIREAVRVIKERD